MPSTPAIQAPNEIWRAIFRLATVSPVRCGPELDYAPFQGPRDEDDAIPGLYSSLQTCLSIFSVCRLWNSLGAEFLYENVRIVNFRGVEGLVEGLERSAAQGELGGLGRHIRRLELPARRTAFRGFEQYPPSYLPFRLVTPNHGLLDRLFTHCRNLEILIRRPCHRLDAEEIHFWGTIISAPHESDQPLLPSLRLVDWQESDLDIRFYSSANSRRLSDIIQKSPNIRHLSVASDRSDVLSRLSLGPSVQTLRVTQSVTRSRNLRDMKLTDMSRISNLTNLVLQASLMRSAPVLSFLTTVGWQLHTLEFAFAPQIIISSNQMYRLLSRCPNLQELAYHLGAPELSPLATFQHSSIKRVRIRIDSEEYYPYKHIVCTQFDVLAGPSFPALQTVILHDEFKSFVRRTSAPSLLKSLAQRGCSVLYADGSEVCGK